MHDFENRVSICFSFFYYGMHNLTFLCQKKKKERERKKKKEKIICV